MPIRATLHGSVSVSVTLPSTFTVSASNSVYPQRADYRCDGTADEVEIAAAIAALPPSGGKITLMDGLFTKSNVAPIAIPSNTEIEIIGTVKLASGINTDAVIFTNSNRTTGNTNISIRGGGTLDCNASGNTSGRQSAIVFYQVTGVNIDISFSNYVGAPYDLNFCYNVRAQRLPTMNPEEKFVNDFESVVTKVTESGSNPLANINGTYGMVFYDADTSIYHFYYMSTAGGTINHATSANGTAWTDDAAHNPMIVKTGQSWHASTLWCPKVWKEGATWYMIYSGRNLGVDTRARVGLATATAPEGPWTDYVGNPVYHNTDTTWGPGAETDGIIKVGPTYYMFINNYGSGLARMSGRIMSTDLIHWTADPHNPIFTDNRYCSWTFAYGNPSNQMYYVIITRMYDTAGTYQTFELYSDRNPTFYPSERTYMGVLKITNRDTTTWNGHGLDVPCVVASSISQNVYSWPFPTLKLYYSGGNPALTILEGLATFDGSVLNKSNMLIDSYTTTNTPVTGGALTATRPYTGTQSLEIGVSAGHEIYRFHFMKTSATVSFWVYCDNVADTINFYLDSATAHKVMAQYVTGALQYKDGSIVICNGIYLPINNWYNFIFGFESNLGKWSLTVRDASGTDLMKLRNLSFDDSVSTVREINSFMIYKFSSQVGKFFIDDLVVE